MQKEKMGEKISRIRLWEITHTKPNGRAINPNTQEKLVSVFTMKLQSDTLVLYV